MDTQDSGYTTPKRILRIRPTPEDPERDAKDRQWHDKRVNLFSERTAFRPYHVAHPWQILDQYDSIVWTMQVHWSHKEPFATHAQVWSNDRVIKVPIQEYLDEKLKYFQWEVDLPIGRQTSDTLSEVRTILNRSRTAYEMLYRDTRDNSPLKTEALMTLALIVKRLDKYKKTGSQPKYPKELAPSWWT